MFQLKRIFISLALFALFLCGTAVSTRADPVTLTPGNSTSFVYQSPTFPGSVAFATFTLSADQAVPARLGAVGRGRAVA